MRVVEIEVSVFVVLIVVVVGIGGKDGERNEHVKDGKIVMRMRKWIPRTTENLR